MADFAYYVIQRNDAINDSLKSLLLEKDTCHETASERPGGSGEEEIDGGAHHGQDTAARPCSPTGTRRGDAVNDDYYCGFCRGQEATILKRTGMSIQHI